MNPLSLPAARAEIARELAPVCERLAAVSNSLVSIEDWPRESLRVLSDAGVLAWGIPEEFGGRDISDVEMLAVYEHLAAACLTTTFVLTQRNAACQRIIASQNRAVQAELLPLLCTGESFATVGISHLTTSRQHLAHPAVSVEVVGDTFLLNGNVPWVTGAKAADEIVSGGTLDDGRQVLSVISTQLAGVHIGEPMRLLALSASQTATMELNGVRVPRERLLFGPIEHVMKQKGGGAGSLTTSSLAIGLTRGVLNRFEQESQRRAELVPIYRALEAEWTDAAGDLYSAAAQSVAPPSAEIVRQKANSLVLRAAQAYLAASKGAGFVAGHPAERAVREAMFFLVWSCPQPVVSAALREFACVLGE